MRTVDSKNYDRKYFEESIRTTLQELRVGKNQILDKIVNMLPLKESDLVVDFGCGSGLLSFALHEKYNCNVVGIDYSQDAIALCNEYHDFLKYKKVSFVSSDISNLPNIENANCIYLADVIEHLYDEEINALFGKVNTWTLDGRKEFSVIIHTDNLNYLKYVRWFVDLIALIFRDTSFSKLKARNVFERERHVNLMTLTRLVKLMRRNGYALKRVEYPEITEERLVSQIGTLGRVPFLCGILCKSYNLIKHLSPSIYCIFVRANVP